MPQTAIYARVSSDSVDQKKALEQQLERLRKAAPDAKEFIEVESGTRSDRPVWEQLMQGCKGGTISRVVATRLDRVSRSRIHGSRILQFFMQSNSSTLELLDDALDLSTTGGRFMAHLLIGWSASESERLGERTRHGHAHRRAQGKPFGPQAPFGYRFNDDRSNYELDPNAAEIARDLIDQYQSERLGLRGCVKYAFEQHGVKFGSQSSFKRWLLNPSLCGFRIYGVSTVSYDDEGNKKRTHNRPGVYGEIHPDAHPPLISEVEHARIVAMFEAPRDQARMPLRDGRVRVATGLGLCGHCSRRLHVHLSGTKYWYRCGNSTCTHTFVNRVQEVELIDTAIKALQHHAKELTGRVVEVVAQDEGEPAEVRELRGQIAKYKRENDPDLAPVIAKKERALSVMMQRPEQYQTLDTAALEELLMGDEAWEQMWRDEPSQLRDLLKSHVFGVLVKEGEIVGVRTRWG